MDIYVCVLCASCDAVLWCCAVLCGVMRSISAGHRVKSISMGKFVADDVRALEENGNEVRPAVRARVQPNLHPTCGARAGAGAARCPPLAPTPLLAS